MKGSCQHFLFSSNSRMARSCPPDIENNELGIDCHETGSSHPLCLLRVWLLPNSSVAMEAVIGTRGKSLPGLCARTLSLDSWSHAMPVVFWIANLEDIPVSEANAVDHSCVVTCNVHGTGRSFLGLVSSYGKMAGL